MFFSLGLDQIDPALLAFVKCHVSTPAKWDVLRLLDSQCGAWINPEQLALQSRRSPHELRQALAELASDGLLDVQPANCPGEASYRLPANEPTSVVLHRLIEATRHSQELRAIIAAHLQHVRQSGGIVRAGAAA